MIIQYVNIMQERRLSAIQYANTDYGKGYELDFKLQTLSNVNPERFWSLQKARILHKTCILSIWAKLIAENSTAL